MRQPQTDKTNIWKNAFKVYYLVWYCVYLFTQMLLTCNSEEEKQILL